VAPEENVMRDQVRGSQCPGDELIPHDQSNDPKCCVKMISHRIHKMSQGHHAGSTHIWAAYFPSNSIAADFGMKETFLTT